MKRSTLLRLFALLFLLGASTSAMRLSAAEKAVPLPAARTAPELPEALPAGAKEIYFAGGCFWGIEEYYSRIPGVLQTAAGYANGTVAEPAYEQVCTGATGHAETVRVRYDPGRVSLETLAAQFFKIIDPLSVNRQGNDRGSQYRTGMYYVQEADKEVLAAVLADEQKKYDRTIVVELLPLSSYYPAEEEHQGYLKKKPGGYCHISFDSLKEVPPEKEAVSDPHSYLRPSGAGLRRFLCAQTYDVVRNAATEPPFSAGTGIMKNRESMWTQQQGSRCLPPRTNTIPGAAGRALPDPFLRRS